MCFMDWRIGRLVRAQITQLESQAGFPIVLKRDMTRVGLTVSNVYAPAAVGEQLGIIEVTPQPTDGSGAGQGLIVASNPLHLTMATHGDLTTWAFSITNIGNVDGGGLVIEYIAPEWLLALGIEELKRASPSWPKGF